jgi:hypothetical protein
MDVKVNVSGSDDAVSEVSRRDSLRELSSRTSSDLKNAALLDEQQSMLDSLIRRQQPCSAKSQHKTL